MSGVQFGRVVQGGGPDVHQTSLIWLGRVPFQSLNFPLRVMLPSDVGSLQGLDCSAIIQWQIVGWQHALFTYPSSSCTPVVESLCGRCDDVGHCHTPAVNLMCCSQPHAESRVLSFSGMLECVADVIHTSVLRTAIVSRGWLLEGILY